MMNRVTDELVITNYEEAMRKKEREVNSIKRIPLHVQEALLILLLHFHILRGRSETTKVTAISS